MLGAEGIKVDEVATAAEGLEALRRGARKRAPYDLAILDVQMPDMDGFQLATAVRQDQTLARTKLLMLTSAGQRGDGERCRELGIRGYLTKPMSRADLLEALGTVLAGPADAGTPDVVTRHTIAESRRSVRVLLAEDNPVNQQVAVAMLVKRGHEVHVVGNGREAVEAIAQREYDVVLMDVQMPEMDGFEATASIRQRERDSGVPRVPIIALTAHAMQGDRQRCLDADMDGYVAKPIQEGELWQAIRQALPAAEVVAPLFDRDATLARVGGNRETLPGLLRVFEERIRQYPEQWHVTAPLWSDRPIAMSPRPARAGSLGGTREERVG